ncbi:glycogen/starch/alpha-glucan phosphorylase, partial [Rhizobium johnstonii]
EFDGAAEADFIGSFAALEFITTHDDKPRYVWKPAERVIAAAFDTPAVGWRGKRVNTLRLWSAQPIDPILLDDFNAGDHIGELRESNKAE